MFTFYNITVFIIQLKAIVLWFCSMNDMNSKEVLLHYVRKLQTDIYRIKEDVHFALILLSEVVRSLVSGKNDFDNSNSIGVGHVPIMYHSSSSSSSSR